MNTMVIDVPSTIYEQLQQEAARTGKSPEVIALELLVATYAPALDKPQRLSNGMRQKPTKAAKQILEEARLIVPLSSTLKSMIIPGVTLDEVQDILSETSGPSLIEILY